MSLEAKTARDQVERWDRGETVWSIEMGGLGPGYEQAIQVLIIEILRDNLDKPLPTEKAWQSFADETVSRIDKDCLGFSGAQVGVAKQVAYRFLKDGPEKALLTASSDRKIQVSNHWPRVTRK